MEKRIEKSYINVHKFSITVFIILLTINVLRWYNFRDTNETCNNCTLLSPYDKPVSNYRDKIDQLIDLNDFKFVLNARRCNQYPEGLLLLIIVFSKASRFERRKFIRNTWGRRIHSTEVVFLLGETDIETINEEVENEYRLYGDIVMGNFVDAYRNLTYKQVMGLKWVYQYCSQAKYVLKSDDDTVVNAVELRRVLAKELSPWGADNLMACRTRIGASVLRDEDSKWRVTVDEYPEDVYPTYCSGWLILYSQDVVWRLLEAAQTLPFFWIDDVHVTGTCADLAGVPRTDFSRYYRMKWELDLTAHELDYFIFGPFDLTLDEMTRIWNALTHSGQLGLSTTSRSVASYG